MRHSENNVLLLYLIGNDLMGIGLLFAMLAISKITPGLSIVLIQKEFYRDSLTMAEYYTLLAVFFFSTIKSLFFMFMGSVKESTPFRGQEVAKSHYDAVSDLWVAVSSLLLLRHMGRLSLSYAPLVTRGVYGIVFSDFMGAVAGIVIIMLFLRVTRETFTVSCVLGGLYGPSLWKWTKGKISKRGLENNAQ